MRIYFTSKTKLDPRALLFMGVPVKDRPDAIGRFGTGLKYAVAWLLRNRHEVRIDGEPVEARPETIRGKTFNLVYFAGQPAGFTTALGPDWEGWMAFRELYANALDEGGTVEAGTRPSCAGTVVEVECPPGLAFAEAYTQRHEIILPSDAGEPRGPFIVRKGPTKWAYVRGVRAGHLPAQAIHVWSHTDPSRSLLTEDRLLKSQFLFEMDAIGAVARSSDREFIRTCLLAPNGSFESRFDYRIVGRHSDVFKEVAWDLRNHPQANQTAIAVARCGGRSYTQIDIDQAEREALARACRVASIICPIRPEEVKVTADFGEPRIAEYNPRTGEIWLSRDALARGDVDLAATLLEEALHKHRGFEDCSRQMQDYLLRQLAYRLTKEVK